jgi:hypothetical protein
VGKRGCNGLEAAICACSNEWTAFLSKAAPFLLQKCSMKGAAFGQKRYFVSNELAAVRKERALQ